MAGYDDTYQMIISTLMGRPVGTEIQPDNQQAYEINMLNYIRSLELLANGPLIGIAEPDTQPIQPNDARACYIAGVAQDRTVTFQNFRNYLGQPIQITNGQMEACLVILIWDTQYWSATQIPTNIISAAETALFYYSYNIKKTYSSVSNMNADSNNPIGTNGKYIQVGDIVSVVNPTNSGENGIYSYTGSGWQLQSSYNFNILQSVGSSVNDTMSQHAITNELNMLKDALYFIASNIYEKTQLSPTRTGGWYQLDGIWYDSTSGYVAFEIDVEDGQYPFIFIEQAMMLGNSASFILFWQGDTVIGSFKGENSTLLTNKPVDVPYGTTRITISTSAPAIIYQLGSAPVTLPDLKKQVDIIGEKVQAICDDGVDLDIPIVFTEDGFYQYNAPKSTGFNANSTYSTLFVPCLEGDEFTASFRLGGTSMAGAIFYDDAGNNVGYEYRGDSADYTDVKIIAPKGATQLAYCSNKSWSGNKLAKKTAKFGTEISKTNQRVQQNADAIAGLNTRLTAAEVVTNDISAHPMLLNIGLVLPDDTNCFYNIAATTKSAARLSGSYNAKFVEVTEGQKFLATAHIGGVSMSVALYYDADGNRIGYEYPGASPSKDYEGVICTVPAGATEMVFQYSLSSSYITPSLQEYSFDFATPIKELQEQNADERLDSLETFQNAISETKSQNVFTGEILNGYLNTSGNFISSTDPTHHCTGLFPVKPNTYYFLSNRQTGAPAIRCVAADGVTKSKVRVATTGEEPGDNLYYYLPNEDGTAQAQNGQFKTSPTAAFLQVNVQFGSTTNPNYAQLMVEEVGDEYNPSFAPSPYSPYEVKTLIKKSALPSDIGGSADNTVNINLNTVPVFMLVGASHGEGYGSVKDKAFISWLSAMMDWTCENWSRSGSDNIEHFNSVVLGQNISNVFPANMPGGYALIVLGGNESYYYSNGVDGKYFRANIIRLCKALSSLGWKPILASYYGDMARPWSLVVRDVAEQYGYPFIDTNAFGSRFYSPLYRPWWYNAHYATRTNVIQWYNFMKILRNLENPTTGLKIFRNRLSAPVDDKNLLFDNKEEKMKLWREITLHHIPLKPDYAKYVDRLDKCVYTDNGQQISLNAVEGVRSEYNDFRLGVANLTFPERALLQFILPSVGDFVSNVLLELESDEDLQVFVRNYNASDLSISLSDSGGGFHITTADPSFTAGATYSDSNNPDITFTVVSYDPTSGFLTTTASTAFQSEGNMTGVLTKLTGLGTSIVEYDQLRTVPGQTYFSKALDVNGKWIQLQYDTVKEGWPISPKGNMDYDRMDILVRTSAGTSFTLKDINLKCNVSQVKKDSRNIYKSFALGVESQDGVQILNKTTFENAVTDWGAPSDAVIWDGKVTYTGPTGTEITGNHIPTYFSSQKGVTRIIRLNTGMSMTQNFNRNLGASYVARRYKMKIVARFYPTEAIDENNLPADVRTSETWDFARFEVKIAIGNNSSWYSRTYYAPLNFVEIEDEWLFDGGEAINNVMTITALDDRIEFLTAEVIAE
jgi:hypothetical protein